MIDDPGAYEQTLLSVLRAHSAAAVSSLQRIDRTLPEKARGLLIMVHLPQDAEGLFSVIVHLEGPDAYALQNAMGQDRTLFNVRFVEGRVVPDVPLFDPFDQPFDVNDAIVDAIMIWMTEVWAAFGGLGKRLPVRVLSPDGFGRRQSLTLAP